MERSNVRDHPIPILLGPVKRNNGYHEDEISRITRLILEALEISFFLCNNLFPQYTLVKLWNIVNQILPTAYILNTSYWVFYSSEIGNCICVCNRFGIRCPHFRNNSHWINMAPIISEPNDKYFLSLLRETVPYPTNVHVFIDPISTDTIRAFDIKLRLTIGKAFSRNKQLISTNGSQGTILIETRYLLTPQYYPLNNALVQFNPIPSSHPNYANYFNVLRRYKCCNLFADQILIPRTLTMVASEKARFSLPSNPNGPTVFSRTGRQRYNNWGEGPFYTFIGNFTQNQISITVPDSVTNMEEQPRLISRFSRDSMSPSRLYRSLKRTQTPISPSEHVISAYHKIKRVIIENVEERQDYNSTVSSPHRPRLSSSIISSSRLELNAQNISSSSYSPNKPSRTRSHSSGNMTQLDSVNFFEDYRRSFPPLPRSTSNFKLPAIMENYVSSTAKDDNPPKRWPQSKPLPSTFENVQNINELPPPTVIEYSDASNDLHVLPPQAQAQMDDVSPSDYLDMVTSVVNKDSAQGYKKVEIKNRKLYRNIFSNLLTDSPDLDDEDLLFIDESFVVDH